mmetsp:Transcript_22492/g.90210  ORF Transcript_22492/g.90210 Transcript_22492/m.90210 type:complete len:122 (-) Transcript_22492:673-1038(-)
MCLVFIISVTLMQAFHILNVDQRLCFQTFASRKGEQFRFLTALARCMLDSRDPHLRVGCPDQANRTEEYGLNPALRQSSEDRAHYPKGARAKRESHERGMLKQHENRRSDLIFTASTLLQR